MAEYKIAETETFQKKIGSAKYRSLYGKLKEYVYPILKQNPYFGPNIKKLKGKLKDLHRYRIGDFRLIYKVIEDKVLVAIIDIENRKDAYK